MRDDYILERLMQGGTVSGETLSEEMGISRAAVWKGILRLREDGWQIDAALAVEDAPIFDKPGFGSPALIEYLRSLPALEGVEFIGLCTDICVITNAMMTKGALPEVPLSVRADCCAGVTPQSHETALQAMRMCQISIV